MRRGKTWQIAYVAKRIIMPTPNKEQSEREQQQTGVDEYGQYVTPSTISTLGTELQRRYRLAHNLTQIAQHLPAVKRELFLLFGQYLDAALERLAYEMENCQNAKVRVDAAYRIAKLVESVISTNFAQTNVLINLSDAEIEQRIKELREVFKEAVRERAASAEEESSAQEELSVDS